VAFIDVYDKRTGEKLPHQVPDHFPDLFPYLSKTPLQKAADKATPATVKKSLPAAPDTKKEVN